MKIITNPDTGQVEKVNKQLELNNGYCPCKLEKTPDTKCICKEFLESSTLGKCHCEKYIKIEL